MRTFYIIIIYVAVLNAPLLPGGEIQSRYIDWPLAIDSPVVWAGETILPRQAHFAWRCFRYGGAELVAVAWMESSLGEDLVHNGRETGPFGLLEGTGDFIKDARIANEIIEACRMKHPDNPADLYRRYWLGRRWHRGISRGNLFAKRLHSIQNIFHQTDPANRFYLQSLSPANPK